MTQSARCDFDGIGCDGFIGDTSEECSCGCHSTWSVVFETNDEVAAWHCDCVIAAVPGGDLVCGQHGPGAGERAAWARSE